MTESFTDSQLEQVLTSMKQHQLEQAADHAGDTILHETVEYKPYDWETEQT